MAAGLLLLLHFALAVGSKRNESTTSDELVHLTAGFSYWENGDYRLHPENGILPQRWAALPTWLRGAKFPELADNEYWRVSDVWVIGHQFFYETGEDHFPRLMAGRAMIALFSVATGLLVFFWSRKFFGDAGAMVSLLFFTFCPSFLAHGALITSDVCMVFFLLASVGAWWRHLHDGRWRWWWLSAVTLGFAFTAKYSAVLLPPMMIAMALVRAGNPAPLHLGGKSFTSAAGKIAAAIVSLAAHGAVVAAIIWVCYGCRFSAANPALPPADHFIHPWQLMMEATGTPGKAIDWAGRLHLLPEAFLYGFAYVLETVGHRAAFLNGEYSVTGWPEFFPWAFLIKTTVPLLIACGLALLVGIKRWRGNSLTVLRSDLYRLTPLMLLFVIYWMTSLTSHLNIGHRHILPTYPVLFIAVGALGLWLRSRRWTLIVVVTCLLGWHAAAAARIAPHFLAYFNELVGGPENGRRHLVDSSLDWGQDLPSLKAWLLKNQSPAEPVYLSYFGSGQAEYYGIRPRRLWCLNNFKFPAIYVPLAPGVYCISATMLSQVYSPTNGQWTLEHEAEYRALRAMEPSFAEYTANPKRRDEVERELPPGRLQQLVKRHDILRLARLCQYLRVRQPDAHAGYSILIYRLSADEVHRATAGSLEEWSALLNQAVAQP